MKRKPTVLICDDSDINREVLSAFLSGSCHIVTAANGQEALDILQKDATRVSLLLLDLVMPVMDGFAVLESLQHEHRLLDLPVIVISSSNAEEDIKKAYDLGASEFIARNTAPDVIRRRIFNTILLYQKRDSLANMLSEEVRNLGTSSALMVTILCHIVERRNHESALHVMHLCSITQILLSHLIEKGLIAWADSETVRLVSIAAALHDIGKMTIPDEIINKPGRFTEAEFAIMKNHSMAGAQMLSELPFQNEPIVQYAYQICRWHHERWDGRGYPDGLKGDEIPMFAQIVSIADVYDALTSDRVYKKAFSHEKSLSMIFNGECGAFNPVLLDAFKQCHEQIREKLTAMKDDPYVFAELMNLEIQEKLRKALQDNSAAGIPAAV